MNYLLHLVVMLSIYWMLALSLNLLLGYGGMLSLAQAAFYALGAYTAALAMVALHLPFAVAVLLSVALAAAFAFLVSWPCLRVRGDVFALCTLGIQVVVYTVAYNWMGLTHGPFGISGIPKPAMFGIRFVEPESFAGLCVATAALTGILSWRLYASPFGRLLRAVRDDEIAAVAAGKNASSVRGRAFMLAACGASLAGVLYATYVSYIDPTSFSLDEAILLVSLVIIGGAGNFRGPLVGTLFVLLLPEALRLLRVPDAVAANMRQIIYGALVIAVAYFRPRGLAGSYQLE